MRKITEIEEVDRVWVGERTKESPDYSVQPPENEIVSNGAYPRGFEPDGSEGLMYYSYDNYDEAYAVPNDGDRVKILYRMRTYRTGIFYDDLEDLDNDSSVDQNVPSFWHGKPGVNVENGSYQPWENIDKFEVIDKADEDDTGKAVVIGDTGYEVKDLSLVIDSYDPHNTMIHDYDESDESDEDDRPNDGDRIRFKALTGTVCEGVYYDNLEHLDKDESKDQSVSVFFQGLSGVDTENGTYTLWKNVDDFEVIDESDEEDDRSDFVEELEQLYTKAAEIDETATLEVANVDFDTEFDGFGQFTVHIYSVTYDVVVNGQTIGQLTLDEDDLDELTQTTEVTTMNDT
jgi:hypothetical protein